MRIKRGTTKKQKHNKVLKAAKGYYGSYRRLYRRAKEALLHAGAYSMAHRRRRRSEMRKEWIRVISAALSGTDVSYNRFMHGLGQNKIQLDRKVLAEIAQYNPEHFTELVKVATA
jgi:large subunit ribosomal protein L20